jgi:hypothetical protein
MIFVSCLNIYGYLRNYQDCLTLAPCGDCGASERAHQIRSKLIEQPGKAAGQGCRARLPGKAAGQRLPGKAAEQGCFMHGEIGQ